MNDDMTINNNPDESIENNANNKGRTFSQDEVNRIVSERLAKERNKGDAEFVKKEQELAERELRLTAKELLSEKNMPVQLLDALKCTDKETLENSISVIEKLLKTNKTETPHGGFRGIKPNESRDNASSKTSVDPDIRKAMGLSG